MKISDTVRSLVGAAAVVVMLAACNGGGSQAPLGSVPLQNASHPDHQRSWIDPAAKHKDLLYVSDGGSGDVDVFTYPDGNAKGSITGLSQPQGECVDAQGDVWIALYSSQEIVEYAHGGANQIASLSDPDYYIEGCAIDPTTGNLAVANFVGNESSSPSPGGVSVYQNGSGSPIVYTDTAINEVFSIGYDKKGDLFADGESPGGYFVFAELPAGSYEFTNLSFDETIATPGAVQWDGKHITVGDATGGEIYQVKVSGSSATTVGTTTLKGSSGLFQPFIDGKKVVGANQYNANVMFWKYPGGGKNTNTLNGFVAPFGTVVSKKP
jgi:hypothetical protein